MRKLCYPTTVSSLSPIDGADRLELAHLSGHAWKCVVGKGEFHPGQRVVYFEIDSALPTTDERFRFLEPRCLKQWKIGDKIVDRCYRIRTMTLRGALSQGLVMPFSAFPEIAEAKDGDDVTDALGVRHYDELSATMLAVIHPGMGDLQVKGPFPSWIPKTDEERIQNLPDWPEQYATVLWQVSVKCDGASATMFWAPSTRPDAPFGVCSRNLELKLEGRNAYTEMAEKFQVAAQLERLGREIAVQGEVVGPGMNGNRDRLVERDFMVFRMWDIVEQRWLSTAECRGLCAELGLHHVPVIDPAITLREIGGVDEILKFAEGKTANGNEREGLVFKTCGNGMRMSFKAVSNRYLLKEAADA